MSHTSDEGTSYCSQCEAYAKERDAWKENAERLAKAANELLIGHDNIYMAHFGQMFKTADPKDDIAAIPMREALSTHEKMKGQ